MSDIAAISSVRRYTTGDQARWDSFLATAKNATFLFYRDYMDYHRDRFADHSLLVFSGEKLAGLLPANLRTDGQLASHDGLTYGGLIVARDATLCEVLTLFQAVLRHLEAQKIPKLIYKRFPSFYNTLPDDEVAYALFLTDAHLYRRDCAMVIPLADRLPFRKRRQGQIKRAGGLGLRVVRETSFQPFWERVLVPQLVDRFGVKPVHTVEEITLLASRFPDNIKQFSVYLGDEILAGQTIYETPSVAHAQYTAATEQGRKTGAVDFLVGTLVDDHFKGKRFYDFGIANENEGRALNQGLLDWKEGFGGRTCTHDFYEITPASHVKLEPVLDTRREFTDESSKAGDPANRN